MLTTSAIAYTWDQIFYRLGINHNGKTFKLGKKTVQFSYGNTSQVVKQKADFYIIITSCSDKDIDNIISKRHEKLVQLEEAEFLPNNKRDFPIRNLPVLFWGNPKAGKFATIKERTLTLHADILAAAFFMLSRYEEVKNNSKDKYGRFPFVESVCSRYDLINYPIVDFYVYVFKYWIEALTGKSIEVPHKFKFLCTHDVDFMFQSHPFFRGLVTLAIDLVKLKFAYIPDDLKALFTSFQDDRYLNDLKYLVNIAQDNGNRDIFYLMPSPRAFSREGYKLDDKRVRYVLDYLKIMEVDIGLHASYESYEQPELYLLEKKHMENALNMPVTSIRQHYLRVQTPQTWRNMDAAGLQVDESYAFSEHEGFRCGTCFDYKVFDVEQDCELELIERPLIVMEISLKSYRNLSLAEAEKSILRLANYCRFVKGNFTLLWHNTSISRDWEAWGQRLPAIIGKLTEMSRSTT